MSGDNTLAGLRKAYACAENEKTSLNTTFRGALRGFAESQSLHFFEDNAANNYITRRGKDASLAPIAIAFPLDGGLSEMSFASAFRVFSLLSKADLPCDLMLAGWTSLGERIVGRDIWDASVIASSHVIPPELELFQQRGNPKDVSISAVFGVSEQMGVALKIEGNRVLVEKTRRLATTQADIRELGKGLTRAPSISIVGPEAESITCSAIREYSAYIVALFDNFD
ncbi:hypothetical protein F4781DRAFT_436431 [Annulohypoxylon bovei var. microspora]|nr:hypothetical protein F4781DRAFT_436431 [Annulohypoxylon bovei var. microspora]